ncbi:O-antigen ligase family protein, partial [Enterococcus faecium]
VVLYGFFFLTKANRGALLCIFIFITLMYIFKSKNRLMKDMKLIIAFLCIVVCYFNFIDIVKSIKEVLNYLSIDIYAIDKTIELIINNKDIDSGRTFLINKMFDSIMDTHSFIWGRGIGFFENKFGIYVHNLFAQYFIEGGIFYVILPLVMVMYIVYKLFSKIKIERLISIFFISAVVVPLLLSNVYWVIPLYWFCLIYVLSSFSKQVIITL